MKKTTRIGASLLAVCILASVSAFGIATGEKVKSKGVVTNHDGNTVIVKTADGPYTLVISADTKVQRPVGLTGLRKKQVSSDVLIPGLRLSFEGLGDDENRVSAKTITFDSDDLAIAEVIQAGLTPTTQLIAQNMKTYEQNKQETNAAIAANGKEIDANKQRISANKAYIAKVQEGTNKRFSELTDWTTAGQSVVNFAVGASSLTEDDAQALSTFADQAVRFKGYVIEVKGYADSTGKAAENQQLSKDRAESVVAYLLQDCHVPIKNIVAPGAMSETHPVASNETAAGRAENRRVELKILVNKAVSGM